MRRKIYDKLPEWRENHNGNTALLVDFSRVNPQVIEFFNLYPKSVIRISLCCMAVRNPLIFPKWTRMIVSFLTQIGH